MKIYQFKLFVVVLFLVFVNCEENFKRKLSATLNPGCEDSSMSDSCDKITVVHIKAESETDALNLIWDFTVPSILTSVTSKNATLTIDWEKFMNGKESVKFSEVPQYTFVTVLNKIYAIYDADDNASIEPGQYKNITTFETQTLTWNRTKFSKNQDSVQVELNAIVNNGTLGLKVSTFSDSGHGADFPHLLHSPNSTQFDLIVNNVSLPFKSSRFAIQLLLASSERKRTNNFVVNVRKNLDDEFTPGIFEIIDVSAEIKEASYPHGYLQYRPVCYLEEQRDVSSSTETKFTKVREISNMTELSESLVPAFFGVTYHSIVLQGMNISFGIKGSGYYSLNNYTSFSFLTGVGEPIPEHLSTFVVVTGFVGLGIPMVVLLLGGVYLGVRRLRRS